MSNIVKIIKSKWMALLAMLMVLGLTVGSGPAFAATTISGLTEATSAASTNELIIDNGTTTYRIDWGDLLRSAPDGTAASPSIAFASDTDTGIYLFSSATIGFTTGGSRRMRLENNYLYSWTTDGPIINFVGATASTPPYTFNVDLDTGMFHPAADTLGWATGGAERMRLDASGNLGVGTTNPEAPLHAVGVVASANGAIFAERSHTTTSTQLLIQRLHAVSTGDMVDGFGPELRFSIEDTAGVVNKIASISAIRDGADNEGAIVLNAGTGGGEEFVRITSSGNVGIGTTPASGVGLHLLQAAGATLRLSRSDPAIGFDLGYDDSYCYIGSHGDTDGIQFRINDVEKLRLDSSGNLGLGVTPKSLWDSAYTVLQFGERGVLAGYGTGDPVWLGDNLYYDGTSNKRIADGYAARIYMNNGQILFSVAGTDLADTAVSWSHALQIDNSAVSTFSGDVKIASDIKKLYLGADDDLSIYHTGSHGYIANATGDLYIDTTGAGGGNIYLRHAGEIGLRSIKNGAVTLYYDNQVALATVGAGVVSLGTADTVRGQLNLLGHATGSSLGGVIYSYMAADYDTNYDYWRHGAMGENYVFQLVSDTKLTILTDGGLAPVTLTAAPASPTSGAFYIADGVTWDPAAKGSGPYPVFYDGTSYYALY